MGSKQFFCEVGHDAYYIKFKGTTCSTLCKFDLMHTPDRSDIGIVQMYILVELNELVVFDYGLSDTQDGLRCLRNEIYILWLTSSPCDKNLGERFRALVKCGSRAGGQGVRTPPPLENHVIWVSIGNKQLDPPGKSWTPGPPLEP